MTTKIKICGMTNVEDVACAIEAGADYIGLIFAESKRRVIRGQAKMIMESFPDFKNWVGVFMNGKKKQIEDQINGLPLKLIQFHGQESPAFCNYFAKRGYQVIKSVPVKCDEVLLGIDRYEKTDFFLFDSIVGSQSGGTGVTFDWQIIERPEFYDKKDQIFLAGGLNPENIASALTKVQPYGVDVSSGLEIKPGEKDHNKIKEFVQIVRKCDASNKS